MRFDVLEQSGPVVGPGDFHVCFEVRIVASEDAVVGFTQGLFLILLGQEQGCPWVFVICQSDPEYVILVVKFSLYEVSK